MEQDEIKVLQHILPDRDMLLHHKVRNSRKLLDGLKSRDDEESDVVPFCSTPKLLITDHVGGPVHNLHQFSAAPHCVNDGKFCIQEIELGLLVPLHVYSARREQHTCIYPNISHCYGRCTILSSLLPLWLRGDRRAGVILQ